MRDYAKISTTLWRSKKFRSVTDEARLFYLYLHTCSHVNSVGCFILPMGYIKADLGWNEDAINKAIDSLSKAYLIGFDHSEEIVRIVDYNKHDPFTNPKHAMGAIKIALSIPDCEEKTILLRELLQDKYAADNEDLIKALHRVSKAYRNPEPEPEPEPEPNNTHASSDEQAGDDQSGKSQIPRNPNCPVQQIIDAYRRCAPNLIQPRIVPDAVKSQISGRWRQSEKHQNIEFWERFFGYCNELPLLTGGVPKRDGSKPFRAGIEWIFNATNFAKIVNGNYEDAAA